MDPTVFSILLALTTVMVVWGIARVAGAIAHADQRKLQQRLSGDAKSPRAAAEMSVVMAQQDAGGLSGWLSRLPMLEALSRQLATAYPEMRLARFLAICFTIGCAVFSMVYVLIDP